MSADMQPAADAGRFMIGTPHVLSLAPLLGSLALINRAGVGLLRRRSQELTEYLFVFAGESLMEKIITPRIDSKRGGHVTIRHPDAGKLSLALRARGVIPDFRPPDLLRLAPSPLYTSFRECEQAMTILNNILVTRTHEHFPERHDFVT
jgi:kynureninase